MNKKGLSQVVTTMLIILISILAIAIIWGAVRPLFQNTSEQISADCISVDLEILSCVVNETSGITNVNIKRNVGEGDLTGFTLIFEKPDASNILLTEQATISVLGSYNLEINISQQAEGLDSSYSVNVAALVGSQQNLCNPLGNPVQCSGV